ncbi:hypothetical protein L195_g047269 [Trifolium pratense]|uniref:Uncharacterized protein n=1 Tax=Trifolium pratense TaxID=57577 RepID=A0A2K3MK39_TRIPR|nr:hypothetical protein L195_g047269 [Trifolium pratense]
MNLVEPRIVKNISTALMNHTWSRNRRGEQPRSQRRRGESRKLPHSFKSKPCYPIRIRATLKGERGVPDEIRAENSRVGQSVL